MITLHELAVHSHSFLHRSSTQKKLKPNHRTYYDRSQLVSY